MLACSRTRAVSVLSRSRTRFLRSAPRQIEGSVRIPLPRIPCRCRGSGWQRAGGASSGSRAPSGACRGPGVGWEEPRVRRRRRQQGLSRGGNTLCYTTAPCQEPGSKHTLPIARFPSVAAVSISFKGRQHLGWVGGLGLFFFIIFFWSFVPCSPSCADLADAKWGERRGGDFLSAAGGGEQPGLAAAAWAREARRQRQSRAGTAGTWRRLALNRLPALGPVCAPRAPARRRRAPRACQHHPAFLPGSVCWCRADNGQAGESLAALQPPCLGLKRGRR